MKTFTIKEFRLQIIWPEIKHRRTDDRHDAYVSLACRVGTWILAIWDATFWFWNRGRLSKRIG